MSSVSPSTKRPGAMRGVLGVRDYRLMMAAGGLDNTGRWMESVVMGLLVLELTDSAFQVALLFVFRWLPMLTFAIFSGMVADRANRWLVMMCVRSAAVAVTAVVLALVLTDLIRPWHLFVASLVLGAMYVLEFPSRRSLIYDIVGGGRIVGAMSLETINTTLGRVIGPFSGGILIETFGFSSAYIMLLAGYTGAFLLIMVVEARIPAQGVGGAQSVRKRFVSGIRYAYRNNVIRSVLGMTLIMNAMAFSVESLFPVVARDHLGVGAGLTGVLVSAQAIGTLGAAFVIGATSLARHHGRVYCLGLTLQMVALVLFAVSPWYSLSFVMLLFAGLGSAGFSTMQSTIILMSSSPEMRGTALGVLAQCIGIAAVGGLIVGAVAELLSAWVAVALSTGLGLTLLLPFLVFSPLMRGPITRADEETGATTREAGAAPEAV